jgi:hypothetical protein
MIKVVGFIGIIAQSQGLMVNFHKSPNRPLAQTKTINSFSIPIEKFDGIQNLEVILLKILFGFILLLTVF